MEKVNFLLQINECKELPCILVHLLKYQSNGNDGFSQKCYRHDDTVHLELHVAVRWSVFYERWDESVTHGMHCQNWRSLFVNPKLFPVHN